MVSFVFVLMEVNYLSLKEGGHGSGGKRRNEGSKKHFDFFKNSNLKEIGAKYNNLCTY